MKTKHTPAPWLQKYREGADENYRTEIFSDVHGGIATCAWTPQNHGNGVTGTYREAVRCGLKPPLRYGHYPLSERVDNESRRHLYFV